MFETVVIATDGSSSAERAVEVAVDLAAGFDATVHACYALDSTEVAETPDGVRDDLADALETAGEDAIAYVEDAAAATGDGPEVVSAVREGEPTVEIVDYAREQDADVIATGTRGRHGEHAFLLGSVAEAVVRESPIPVLTVRQLEGEEDPKTAV